MSYKLLAVDVDGTLLRRDGVVSPDDVAAIARLRAAGVPVAIATGRLFSGTRRIAREAGIVGPIACVDGSHIVDVASERELLHVPIPPPGAALVRSLVERHALPSFLFAHDSIVHDAHGSAFAPYVKTWSDSIEEVASVPAHGHWTHERGIMAVVSIGPHEAIASAADEIQKHASGAAVLTFPVVRIAMSAMIVRASGVTKGSAIRWLGEHYGCTAAEIAVVGDWLNDVPMFEVAGCSFAMAQAPAILKEKATHVLEESALTGGGVATAIHRAFGV